MDEKKLSEHIIDSALLGNVRKRAIAVSPLHPTLEPSPSLMSKSDFLLKLSLSFLTLFLYAK